MITLLKLIDWITDKCILLGCLFILLIASLGLYTNYFLYRNASATNYKEYKKSNIDFKRLKKLNPEVIG